MGRSTGGAGGTAAALQRGHQLCDFHRWRWRQPLCQLTAVELLGLLMDRRLVFVKLLHFLSCFAGAAWGRYQGVYLNTHRHLTPVENGLVRGGGLLAKFLFTPLVSCPHAVASCAAPVSAAARCPRWPADGGAAPVGSGARGATPPTRARCSCSP